jgi:hypothetical protein
MNLFTFSSEFTDNQSFLLKLGAIIVGFLFVFLSVNYLYVNNLVTPLELFGDKTNSFKREKGPVKLIFLGDSHPGLGIKNRYLPDRFHNLSFVNHNLKDQRLLLEWAHSLHPELEYVVLQADFHVFAEKATQWSSPKYSMYFADYSKIQSVYGLSYLELAKSIAYFHYPLLDPKRRFNFPKFIYFYSRKVLSNRSGEINQERYRLDRFNDLNYLRTFRWNQASRDHQQFAAQRRIRRQFGSNQPHIDPELVETFKSIQEYTLRNDLKIIYVRYPVTGEYLSNIPLSGPEKKRFRDLLKSKNTVLRLNLSRTFENRLHLFRNSDHLNYEGGKVLTKLFVRTFNERINSTKSDSTSKTANVSPSGTNNYR